MGGEDKKAVTWVSGTAIFLLITTVLLSIEYSRDCPLKHSFNTCFIGAFFTSIVTFGKSASISFV